MLASVFALFFFPLYYAIELHFDRLHVFDQFDVVFDGDANYGIAHMADAVGRRTLVHPNLANFFGLPNRLVARVAVLSGLYSGDEAALRRTLALLILPLCSAITLALAFWLFYSLGFSLGHAALLTLLMGVSFSQVIFGSMPDHFGLSGLALVAAFVLAADMLKNHGKVRFFAWWLVAFFAVGITVTNVLSIGILFAVSYLFACGFTSANWRRLAIYSLVMATTLGVATCATSALSATFFNGRFQVLTYHLKDFWRSDILQRTLTYPVAMTDTLAPAGVTVTHNQGVTPQDRYQFEFTLEESTSLLYVIPGLVLLGVGAVGGLRRDRTMRALAISSLLILAYHLAMLVGWGDCHFLYSQNWLLPLMVLLAGVLTFEERYRPLASGTLALLVVGVALNSAFRLHEMFAILESIGG